jgi:hypothetical protein
MFRGALPSFLCLAMSVISAHAQPSTAGPSIGQALDLGPLRRVFELQGQFSTGQRAHYYKFSLPAADCVRVEGLTASTKMRFFLRDAGGGELAVAYRDAFPPRGRHQTSFTSRLLPNTYVLHAELSRNNDSAGTYQIVVSRGC